MTLLSVVQSVCRVVGVEAPNVIFANINTDRTAQEMLDLANEMARRIAWDTRDWTLFRAVGTIAGDGTTTAFPLPVDYKRLLLTSNVWRSTSSITPMEFVPNFDVWVNRRTRNIYRGWGEWAIFGGNLNLAPAPAVGQTVTYTYLKKYCINLASSPGGVGDSFISDNDTFMLDERVLRLGMIWQWKAQKGSAYQEDMATYDDAIAMIAGTDAPQPIIIGRLPISAATRAYYPFATVPSS